MSYLVISEIKTLCLFSIAIFEPNTLFFSTLLFSTKFQPFLPSFLLSVGEVTHSLLFASILILVPFFHMGSDAITKIREILRKDGITYVLNCVGFVSPEYFV